METMAREMLDFECILKVQVRATDHQQAALAAAASVAATEYPVFGVRLLDRAGRPRMVDTAVAEDMAAYPDGAISEQAG